MQTKPKVKKIYILPGLGESPRGKAYMTISAMARTKKYKAIIVKTPWDKSPRSWIKNAEKELRGANKSDVVLGFSFGSYIGAILSTKIEPKNFIFCSISPYFRDDIKDLPELAYKFLGAKKIKQLGENVFPTKSKTPAIFMVGNKDLEIVINRSKKSFKAWGGKKKIKIVKNAPHDIGDKNYLEEIKKYI